MIPTSFDESNDYLGPPPNMENCESLSILRINDPDQSMVISCWKLTAEELAEVNKTGRVWLTVVGHTMPPARLDGVKPI